MKHGLQISIYNHKVSDNYDKCVNVGYFCKNVLGKTGPATLPELPLF